MQPIHSNPKTTRFSKRLQGHCITSSGSCIVVRSLQAVQAFPRQFYRVCGGVLKIENVSLPPLQLKMDLDLAHRDRCRPRSSRSHTTLFQPDPCPPVAAGRSFRRTSQLRCRHKPRPAVGIGTLIARNERAPCRAPQAFAVSTINNNRRRGSSQPRTIDSNSSLGAVGNLQK